MRKNICMFVYMYMHVFMLFMQQQQQLPVVGNNCII